MFGKNAYRFFATLRMTAVLASALLLASACSKVETWVDGADPVPVTFSTYAQRSTKADASYVAPGGDFAEDAVVGVFGFYHDNTAWDTDPSNIADFMYNTALTKQSDDSWTYSPIKYWPNEYGTGANSTNVDKLSFWGYYPRIIADNYSSDVVMFHDPDDATGDERTSAKLRFYKPDASGDAYDNDTPGLPKVAFTQDTDPAKQVDLMFSLPVKDVYKTQSHEVDPQTHETHNYGNLTNGEVTLVFKHALALVEFQLAEGTGAELNLLELTHINKTGTMADPGIVPFVWSEVNGEYTTRIENLDVNETTLLRILAIPQELSADATLTLNYNITFASSDPTHPDPIVYSGNSFSVKLFDNTNPDTSKRYGVTAWEAGKHYIYKVSAGLDRIEFEEIVEFSDDWSVGAPDISVPEP